jgi:hypothetical protein
MEYITNLLPDNKTIDLQFYILDPLSVIIKLAILSNKPIGSKICIDKNIIYIQDPGIFQSVCRYAFKNDKTDLQYLYNPIEIACKQYLNVKVVQQYPKIPDLFKCAQNGILKLIETYRSCSIMRLCLNYFYSIISNHFVLLKDNKFIDVFFRKDIMTPLYTEEINDKLEKLWSPDKIKIILNITSYLSILNENAETDVKSLETIIDSIDKQVQKILI